MTVRFSDIYLLIIGLIGGFVLDINHWWRIIYIMAAAGMVPLFRYLMEF